MTKIVYVDHDKCILCKSCIGACVNGVIRLDTHEMKIIKCNHCEGDPECVKVCPTGAIQYGPADTITTVDRHGKLSAYLREIRRVANAED